MQNEATSIAPNISADGSATGFVSPAGISIHVKVFVVILGSVLDLEMNGSSQIMKNMFASCEVIGSRFEPY